MPRRSRRAAGSPGRRPPRRPPDAPPGGRSRSSWRAAPRPAAGRRRTASPRPGRSRGRTPRAGSRWARTPPRSGRASRPHRLGAVEGEPPAREVEPGPVLRPDLLHAEVVGEVRPAAGRPPVAGDRLQPAPRPLQEGHRRHQHAPAAAVERLQHVPDQPHVVVERQPAHHHGRCVLAEGLLDQPLVVQQVAVGDHHPLGRRGRAGGVLEEGGGVGRRLRPVPAGGGRGEIVGGDPAQAGELRLAAGELGGIGQQLRRGQHHPRAGVADNRGKTRLVAPRPRGVGRHRHHAGVETAEEGGDEVEPGGEEQQRAVPRRARLAQRRGHDPGAAVQLGGGEPAGLRLAVLQKGVDRRLRLLTRAGQARAEESPQTEIFETGLHGDETQADAGIAVRSWCSEVDRSYST